VSATSLTIRPLVTDVPSPLPTLTPPKPEISPLKRQDVPPEGVVAQLTIGEPGLVMCLASNPTHNPSINLWPESTQKVEILQLFDICFDGFKSDKDIHIQIILPDGNVRRNRENEIYSGSGFGWRILPGAPLGRYTINATDGSSSATTSFTVEAASQPTMFVINDDVPGAPIRIALAGFEPYQTVPLYLYKHRDNDVCGNNADTCYRFSSSLPPAQVDEHGEAVYSLNTAVDDPLGEYLVDIPGAATSLLFDKLFSIEVINLTSLATTSASSTLSEENVRGKQVQYDAKRALDNDPTTSWVEGIRDSPGIGEWLKLDFEHPINVTRLELDIGYDSDEKVFFLNNRVRNAKIIFSDGTEKDVEFLDQRGIQSISIDGITTTSITIVIQQVYPGKVNDTPIAEVRVLGH